VKRRMRWRLRIEEVAEASSMCGGGERGIGGAI